MCLILHGSLLGPFGRDPCGNYFGKYKQRKSEVTHICLLSLFAWGNPLCFNVLSYLNFQLSYLTLLLIRFIR